MSYDPHLRSVLWSASREDLEPIASLAAEKSSTFVYEQVWSLNELRHNLEIELRENGGNSFVNMFRGSGPAWAEIVRDVADKLGVKYRNSDGTTEIEQRVAMHVLERAIDEMTPEQRAELRANLCRAGLPNDLPLGKGALIAGLAAGNMAGFAAYQMLVIIANAVAKTLIGQGLNFAANATLTRMLAVALGPIGWALAAIWTVIDIAGPAYRLTIPSVVMIGVLRAQQA